MTKHIPIKYLQQIRSIIMCDGYFKRDGYKLYLNTTSEETIWCKENPVIEWLDVKGTNTPYLSTVISFKESKSL